MIQMDDVILIMMLYSILALYITMYSMKFKSFSYQIITMFEDNYPARTKRIILVNGTYMYVYTSYSIIILYVDSQWYIHVCIYIMQYNYTVCG